MSTRTAGLALRPLGLACLLLAGIPAVAPAFDEAEVRAIVGNTRAVEANPDARGIWMARQRTVNIDGSGNGFITEHLLARVLDPDWGQERFTPYRRIFWSELASLAARGRIWSSRTESTDIPADSIRFGPAPEGGGIASYQNLRECRISLPRLEPGQVVELVLTWNCPIPQHDRNARWLEETFGAEDPVIEQQLVLITPSAMNFTAATIGPPLKPQIRQTGGARIQTWLTGNLPPVPARFVESPWSRVPAPDDTVGSGVTRVVVSSLGSWDFAATYFGAQWEDSWARRSAEIDRLVSRAIKKAKDPRARALAVAAEVESEYRVLPVPDLLLGLWPQPASLVALSRAGGSRDLAVFLVAALRAAGVEASPVLVRERRDGWDESLPALVQFDRTVVRARPAGSETLWLDPIHAPRAIPPGRGLLFVGTQDGPELRAEAGLVDFPGLPGTDR